jgi:hypothetical protein
VTAARLREVGIEGDDTFGKLGSIAAYRRVKHAGFAALV